MRALVTGGAGFIGSHLVDALLARGDDVAVLDDLSTGRRQNLRGALAGGARLHEASIVDRSRVARVVAAVAPEVVFHLAAQIDVRRSVREPAFDARVNVEGTINMLEAARLSGARRVVFASTGGAIYGEAQLVPTPEDAPVRPPAPYGQGKVAAEGYLGLFGDLHGLSCVALRAGNVYGPRQDPLGEAGVAAILCARVLDGATATIFGDGLQTRDFVYVGDVVDAYLRAAACDVRAPVNVAGGHEVTVLALAEALRKLGAGRLQTVHGPPRLGEVRRSCLDVRRAAETLGWRARVTLGEGLRRTLACLDGGDGGDGGAGGAGGDSGTGA